MAAKHRPLIFLTGLMVLTLARPLRAAAGEPPRQLQFTIFATGRLPDLVYQIAARPVPRFAPVMLFPSSRSPVYHYEGWDDLCLFEAGSRRLLARAEVPRSISRALLIVAPWPQAPPAGPSHRVYVFDDSTTHLPPGTLGILNMSGFRLAGAWGAQPLDLEQGYRGPFPCHETVAVQLAVTVRSRRYQAFADRLSAGAGQRGILILLPPYRRGSVEIQYRLLLEEPQSAEPVKSPPRVD
jgi:hypothetical protein